MEDTKVGTPRGEDLEAVAVSPMEVENPTTSGPKKAKCIDLPDQNSRSLSMFLLVGLLLTLTCCVIWMWYFKNEAVFPNYTVTSPMIDELVTFTAIVCTIVILSGFYGVLSIDRGWLLVTIIGQVCIINTIHFGLRTTDKNSDAQIKRIDAFLLVACIFTAWAAWRTSEKIQEEQFEKQLSLRKGDFLLSLGLDLPDMTNVGMELWLIGFSLCLVLFGLVFIILGALNGTDSANAYPLIWHMITCGVFQMLAGIAYLVFWKLGYSRTRITLTITMMLSMFAMIMICTMTGWLCFSRAFFKYECDGFNAIIAASPYAKGSIIDDCDGKTKLRTAQVVFQYLSGILTATHVWLAWRLSEGVQTNALYDDAGKDATSISVFSEPFKLLGVQVNKPHALYVKSLLISCFFVFAAAWGFMGTWFVLNRADTSTFSEDEATTFGTLSTNILDNYINVCINIAAVVCALFGVYDNDRGVLLMATLLFFTACGYNYHDFMAEYANWSRPSWFLGGNYLPQNMIKDIGRISSYSRVITLISSWFGAFNTYVIAEIIQEKRIIRESL